jgi:colicin import membrane protein
MSWFAGANAGANANANANAKAAAEAERKAAAAAAEAERKAAAEEAAAAQRRDADAILEAGEGPVLPGGGAAAERRSRKQSGGAKSAKAKKTRKASKTPAVGSKAQVFHGSAKHTSGGLTKSDLMKHKGRIVSRKKHALGKKAFKNLVKAGYKPKKGTFKLFK